MSSRKDQVAMKTEAELCQAVKGDYCIKMYQAVLHTAVSSYGERLLQTAVSSCKGRLLHTVVSSYGERLLQTAV